MTGARYLNVQLWAAQGHQKYINPSNFKSDSIIITGFYV